MEAAHGANLNLVDWMRGNYSNSEKAVILAWWQGHIKVAEHSNDAVQSSVKK